LSYTDAGDVTAGQKRRATILKLLLEHKQMGFTELRDEVVALCKCGKSTVEFEIKAMAEEGLIDQPKARGPYTRAELI